MTLINRIVVLALAFSMSACGNHGVMSALGCDWDIKNLRDPGDGVFVRADVEPPFDFYTISFSEEPFVGSIAGFDLIETNQDTDGLTVRQYVVADRSNSSIASVISRNGFDGHIEIYGRDYSDFLIGCN